LVSTGRGRYAWVTLLPMVFVTTTTLTAGVKMIPQFAALVGNGTWSPLKGWLNIGMMVFVMACVGALLLQAAARWLAVLNGVIPVQPEAPVSPQPWSSAAKENGPYGKHPAR